MTCTTIHLGAALLREPERGGQHLLADLAELQRHQDPLRAELGARDEVGNGGRGPPEQALPAARRDIR